MSYVRWGSEGSSVYVFLNVGGWLDCCGCRMREGHVQCFTTEDMLAHLREHRDRGDCVPQFCFDGLTEDQEANDEWIRSTWDSGYVRGSSTPYGKRSERTEDNPFGFEHYFTVFGYRPMPGVEPKAAKRVLGLI